MPASFVNYTTLCLACMHACGHIAILYPPFLFLVLPHHYKYMLLVGLDLLVYRSDLFLSLSFFLLLLVCKGYYGKVEEV